MTTQTIRDLLDLPETMPRCVVEINTFDDPNELRDNVKDYVITPTVAEELSTLTTRIIASMRRNEPGDGHYVHGAFGSGKSHFMGMLGLILANNSVVWEKEHLVIQEVKDEHGKWIANNPILVIPVFMLGKKIPFQYSIYEAANDRLRALGKPPCEFSEAKKIIERFRRNVGRYGNQVWEKFQAAEGYSQKRFDKMATGSDVDKDSIAQAILRYEGDLSEAERQMLYPSSISQGVEKLTQHAKDLGFMGVVYLVDELILYLTGKSGEEWLEEFGDVVATVDNRQAQQIPLWLVIARQKEIADIAPTPGANVSEKDINDEMEHHQDRFPYTTRLPDRELVAIVEERILRPRDNVSQKTITLAVNKTIDQLSSEVKDTLVHDLNQVDFVRLYPFHPALIRTLIDVTARLSRERTAIRLLYELLIERHKNIQLGELVPYASLFDTVFEPEGVKSGRQHPELEAVWETSYKRIFPIIEELCKDEIANSQAQDPGSDFLSMQAIVKTILLAQLTSSLREQINVERILHLNYTDLKGRTDFGSLNRIHSILNQLDNRTELLNFQPNLQEPGKGIVSITVTAGPQLSEALKRVRLNTKMRYDAFEDLIKRQLGNKSINNGVLQNYNLLWRGVDRKGRVQFKNVRELKEHDMSVPENKEEEFTLFIDYPWDDDPSKGKSDDQLAIERGRQSRGSIPVGFWLPQIFEGTEIRDLDEYAQILELEENLDYYLGDDYSKRARDEIRNKLPGFKQTKERNISGAIKKAFLQGDVTFLDAEIKPSIFVENVNEGLDRVAREVFRRLHPQHPRFKRKITVASLRRFLDEVLVEASRYGGKVDKNIDREDLAKSIGEPLDLVDIGSIKIGIRTQSRFLGRVVELSSGSQVDADQIRQKLQEEYGFKDDLVDFFLLYLIKASGYRVIKNDRPVDSASINFGKLTGIILERGEQLEIHEWTKVKREITDIWGLKTEAPELTIAAQDELWTKVNARAADLKIELKNIQSRLKVLITNAGGTPSETARMKSVQAAIALNALAQEKNSNSFKGLNGVLEWNPEIDEVERKDAKQVLRERSEIQNALTELSADTVQRIKRMSDTGDNGAKVIQDDVLEFLSQLQGDAHLTSHVRSWLEKANRLIDDRLGQSTGTTINVAQADENGEKHKVSDISLMITDAKLVIHGKKRPITPMARDALLPFFNQTAEKDISGKIKVEVHVESDEE